MDGLNFLEAFKAMHRGHQVVHIGEGPCTARCNNAPRCDSNNCEMLLPLHAGYDLLLRAWLALHPPPRGADSPCAATSATLDYPAERCLPYIFPLKSVADECADAPAYEYPELPEWVELGRGKREL